MNSVFSFSLPFRAAVMAAAALLSACTSTKVTISPANQAPIYQPKSEVKTAVLWTTRWRPNQKDVPQREAAASQGLVDFLADPRCFATSSVVRVDDGGVKPVVPRGADALLVLTVRELGPTVKLLSSLALVEGGTEVVVDVALYLKGSSKPDREFTIHWRSGGPGRIKGVKSLPADLAAALRAGLLGLRDGLQDGGD
jgi:hypothetical protein